MTLPHTLRPTLEAGLRVLALDPAFAAGDARDRAFLRLWCAKEAVLKAHGHGLSFGLEKLRFAESDGALALVECARGLGRAGDWSLREFVPAPEYVAALAWRDPPAR
jgi:4'-phosphopantetheinyl transferase